MLVWSRLLDCPTSTLPRSSTFWITAASDLLLSKLSYTLLSTSKSFWTFAPRRTSMSPPTLPLVTTSTARTELLMTPLLLMLLTSLERPLLKSASHGLPSAVPLSFPRVSLHPVSLRTSKTLSLTRSTLTACPVLDHATPDTTTPARKSGTATFSTSKRARQTIVNIQAIKHIFCILSTHTHTHMPTQHIQTQCVSWTLCFIHACMYRRREKRYGISQHEGKKKVLLNKKKKRKKGVLGEGNCHLPI